jgi:hypothetical protein
MPTHLHSPAPYRRGPCGSLTTWAGLSVEWVRGKNVVCARDLSARTSGRRRNCSLWRPAPLWRGPTLLLSFAWRAVRARAHTRANASIHAQLTYTSIHTQMPTCVHTRVHTHVLIQIYIYKYKYKYIYTYIYIYIHIRMCVWAVCGLCVCVCVCVYTGGHDHL